MSENSTSSFDRLVSGLTENERKDLLGKMIIDGSEDNKSSVHSNDEDIDFSTFAQEYKSESIVLRLWLWLKSVITSVQVQQLYNERKVHYLANKIEKVSSNVIDYKKELILSSFYNKLTELKITADFFKPYISVLDDSDSDFYIFLSSFIMDQVTKDLESDANPYSNPTTFGAKSEIRMGLLKRMDEIMASISPGEKSNMYVAVRSIEWLKNFCKLPLARMMTYFNNVVEGFNTCTFAAISGELQGFAKIMCNVVPISEAVLEALYIFAMRKKNIEVNTEDSTSNVADFVSKARSQLAMVNMFIQTVPLRSICCVVFGDVNLNIGTFTGGEDWFAKYKAKWKKIFDQKWLAWSNDCKKETIRHSLVVNFGLENFPKLPERPWSNLWGSGIPFRYELTGGFLVWYFSEVFHKHEINLKMLMTEADFVKKENRTTFTEAFNLLVQVSIDLTNFTRRLSDLGDVGMMLKKVREEKIRTLQGSQKAEALIRSIESDMASVIVRFGEASRNIELVLAGIFNERTDTRFEGLTNFNHLQGRNNEQFKLKLKEARDSVGNALALLKELEPIDAQVI